MHYLDYQFDKKTSMWTPSITKILKHYCCLKRVLYMAKANQWQWVLVPFIETTMVMYVDKICFPSFKTIGTQPHILLQDKQDRGKDFKYSYNIKWH